MLSLDLGTDGFSHGGCFLLFSLTVVKQVLIAVGATGLLVGDFVLCCVVLREMMRSEWLKGGLVMSCFTGGSLFQIRTKVKLS